MRILFPAMLAAACLCAQAQTVTLKATGRAPHALGSTIWFVAQVDGVGRNLPLYVNGIPGGNATVGTINHQNGQYVAPARMPPGGAVTVSARTTTAPIVSGSLTLLFKTEGPATPLPGPVSEPVPPAPVDAASCAHGACWNTPPSAPTRRRSRACAASALAPG